MKFDTVFGGAFYNKSLNESFAKTRKDLRKDQTKTKLVNLDRLDTPPGAQMLLGFK